MSSNFRILKFGLVNVNKLMNKMDQVSLFAGNCCLDIFAICEAWLVHSKVSFFVSVNRYVVVRGDTHGTIRKHGICLYVRASFSMK